MGIYMCLFVFETSLKWPLEEMQLMKHLHWLLFLVLVGAAWYPPRIDTRFKKKLLNFLEAIVSSWKSIEFPGCLKELNSRATIPSQMKSQFGWFVHPTRLLMRNLDNSEVRCFCHIQLVRDHSRTLNTLLRLHLLAGLGTPWWNVFLVLNFSCDSAHELTLCLNLYTS